MQRSLNGRTVYKGIAKGNIIYYRKSLSYTLLRKKTILVVKILSAEIVPFLKSIKGVIAEKGGITSHPAIVCRELKVPSIVGVSITDIKVKEHESVKLNTFNKTINIENE